MDDLSKFSYDANWSEHVELKDGTEAVLRLIRPADRELLEQGFKQLSAKSRYTRFLGGKSSLSARDLEYLSNIDNVDHVAIGAIDAESGEGVGVARCIRLKNGGRVAEAAVTVVDAYQGKGLGRALLGHLIRAARERDIDRFRNTLFAQNRPMRALIEDLGGPIEVVERDGGVLTIETKLDPASHADEEPEPAPTGPLYRALRMAAEGAISIVERLRAAGRRGERQNGDAPEE